MAASKGDVVLRANYDQRSRGRLERSDYGQEHMGEHTTEVQATPKAREHSDQQQ